MASALELAWPVLALPSGPPFFMIVRLADTFDFRVQTREQFIADAKMLLRRGYAPEPG